ncbi:MAG TPA: hypothetical protein VM901_11600 [Bdellovibrionota bacterium]|jgi:hypothetical protein|nr:hypothetical protein [Bdellovibrionota bacterium]
MNKLKLFSTLTLTALLPGVAFADQCAVLSEKQAKAAVAAISLTQRVGHLCEPCGEEPTEIGGPTFDEATESVGIRKWDGHSKRNQFEVLINDQPVDLAYTYVLMSTSTDNGAKNYVNLALLAGCDASGVTPVLKVGE